MKKILILLIAIVSLFSFNEVKAEEISEENFYLLRDKILESCTECTEENYPYFIIFNDTMNKNHLLISNDLWTYYYDDSTKLNKLKLNGGFKLYRYNSDSSFTSINTSFDQAFKIIYYSNYDILNDDGSVFFAKNYPIDDDVEPDPSPTPTPSPLNITNKIYLPNTNYKCYVVRSEEVIRAYEEIPTSNSTVSYRDYYYNSNYLYNDGVQTFSQYSTLPICLDSSVISDNVYYRTDLDKILVIFLILSIFCFYIPIKIFLRFFRRFN